MLCTWTQKVTDPVVSWTRLSVNQKLTISWFIINFLVVMLQKSQLLLVTPYSWNFCWIRQAYVEKFSHSNCWVVSFSIYINIKKHLTVWKESIKGNSACYWRRWAQQGSSKPLSSLLYRNVEFTEDLPRQVYRLPDSSFCLGDWCTLDGSESLFLLQLFPCPG